MGGGQDAQATVSSPPAVKIIRAGVKIPWEILTPGGQAGRGYLDSRGSSCLGVKINRYTGLPTDPSKCDCKVFFASGEKKICQLNLVAWAKK